ncbi:MAG: hypothetical protein ACRD92_01210, partial [Nitrosopumilaceae archaeon]
MQRSLLRFENAIKSEATRKAYHYFLNRFLVWSKINEADGMLQLKDSFIQQLLEDYLFHLKRSINPNSIPMFFAPLELFLTMNDKVVNFKKIHKMYPEKGAKSGKDAYTNQDIQT